MEPTEGAADPPARCGSTASARRSADRPPGLDEHGSDLRAWLGQGYSASGDPAV